MTTFTETPADYIGTHRYTATVVADVCRCHPDCNARLLSDRNPAGDVHGDEYTGRHVWNVRRHRQAPWVGAS